MNVENFGIYLRNIRKSRQVSIRQLALLSGVSNAYLSQLENNLRDIPSPKILKKLSKPLGVTYMELMVAAGHLEAGEFYEPKNN